MKRNACGASGGGEGSGEGRARPLARFEAYLERRFVCLCVFCLMVWVVKFFSVGGGYWVAWGGGMAVVGAVPPWAVGRWFRPRGRAWLWLFAVVPWLICCGTACADWEFGAWWVPLARGAILFLLLPWSPMAFALHGIRPRVARWVQACEVAHQLLLCVLLVSFDAGVG